MAKALGLIGNFKGKLGNTVGYSLKDSNNKQTQGVRVYQPVVRNPKTAAQAEQRAKLAPINATYRALKMVIDRGQQGKAYGNKSRLAWLSDAIKAFNGGWFDKGAAITAPALVPLTKGSVPANLYFSSNEPNIKIAVQDVSSASTNTMGKLSQALLDEFTALHDGDQITFVITHVNGSNIETLIESIVLNTSSTEAIPSFVTVDDNQIIIFNDIDDGTAAAVIVSREGDNGAHLRNNTSLVKLQFYSADLLTDAAKEAAIKSYMSQGANTDWAEESLM